MSLTKLFKKLRGGLKKKLEEESANVCLDTSQVNAKMLEKLYQAKIVENALNVGEKVFLLFYYYFQFSIFQFYFLFY